MGQGLWVVPSLPPRARDDRSEEHTSELQSQSNLVCRLLLEKKNRIIHTRRTTIPMIYIRSRLYYRLNLVRRKPTPTVKKCIVCVEIKISTHRNHHIITVYTC